jgi:hypothetical protein
MSKVDKFKKVLALVLALALVLLLIFYGGYKIYIHFYQGTCSKYTCPTGYQSKDNSDKINCKGSVCNESDDKDTCCNKSVNCEGSWSNFGACSHDCGGGTQTRTYTVTTQPQYGGTPCPTSQGSQDSQACNTAACATCSSFDCTGTYSPRAGADDVSCGKTQCDSINIDLCCENIQDGNDVTEGDNDVAGDDDTGVVDVPNATCSTVPENCPVGYLYKTDSAGMECNGLTCDVGTGGVDLDTCCEQGCTSPGTMPTGYTGSLPDTLPLGGGDLTAELEESTGSTVQCATNYHGTATYTCSTAALFRAYTLSGCDPDMCTTPDTTGYNIAGEPHLEKPNFLVNVTCEDGYGSSTAATAQAVACESDGGTYSLTGCENKTGFCSGNTSVPDVTCGDGYTLKSDSDRIVDRNTASCCDPWTCTISESDRELYNIQVGGSSISGNTISYTDIDSDSVTCAGDAQRTDENINISCVETGGNYNVNLSGCGPVSAPEISWFWAEDAEVGENCNVVCHNQGKTCNSSLLMSSLDDLQGIGNSDCHYWNMSVSQGVPYQNTNSNICYYKSTLIQEQDQERPTCDHIYDYQRRLCPCE